jgi:hypothetical protein
MHQRRTYHLRSWQGAYETEWQEARAGVVAKELGIRRSFVFANGLLTSEVLAKYIFEVESDRTILTRWLPSGERPVRFGCPLLNFAIL